MQPANICVKDLFPMNIMTEIEIWDRHFKNCNQKLNSSGYSNFCAYSTFIDSLNPSKWKLSRKKKSENSIIFMVYGVSKWQCLQLTKKRFVFSHFFSKETFHFHGFILPFKMQKYLRKCMDDLVWVLLIQHLPYFYQ